MKRLMTMFLALMLVFALSACELLNGISQTIEANTSITNSTLEENMPEKTTPAEEKTETTPKENEEESTPAENEGETTPAEEETETTPGKDETPTEPYLDTPYEYIVDSYRVSFVFDVFGEDVGMIVIIKDAPKDASITLKQFLNQVYVPVVMNGEENIDDSYFLEMGLKVNGASADASTPVYNGSVINIIGERIVEDGDLNNPEYFESNSYQVNYRTGMINGKENVYAMYLFVNIVADSSASVTFRDFIADVFLPSQESDLDPDEYLDVLLQNSFCEVDGKLASADTLIYNGSVISLFFGIHTEQCPPHYWTDGKCDRCGETCAHEEWDESGCCLICGTHLGVELITVIIRENDVDVFSTQTNEICLNDLLLSWYGRPLEMLIAEYDISINEIPVIDGDYMITKSCTVVLQSRNENNFVEDTNSYYFIGNGMGDMRQAVWNHEQAEKNLTMTKEDIENTNVYTITITLYAGDMFQICYGGSWAGQIGIGFIEGAEYCDGINIYDGEYYTAADKKVAQVKNAAGEVVFIGNDEFNNAFEVWNVQLAEEMDGIYRFTYTTYPDKSERNLISFELVEKLDALDNTHDMCIIGTHNEWRSDFDKSSPLRLVESDDKKTWSGLFTVTENMYADWTENDSANPLGVKCVAFKLFNTVDGAYYGDNNGNNFYATAGVYYIEYTVENNQIKVEKIENNYYLVGTFVDPEGNAVVFEVENGVTPLLTVENGVATGVLVATDVSHVEDHSWLKYFGYEFGFKVVYGSEYCIYEWYGREDGDNFYVDAGTYYVSFDIETQKTTITPIDN